MESTGPPVVAVAHPGAALYPSLNSFGRAPSRRPMLQRGAFSSSQLTAVRYSADSGFRRGEEDTDCGVGNNHCALPQPTTQASINAARVQSARMNTEQRQFHKEEEFDRAVSVCEVMHYLRAFLRVAWDAFLMTLSSEDIYYNVRTTLPTAAARIRVKTMLEKYALVLRSAAMIQGLMNAVVYRLITQHVRRTGAPDGFPPALIIPDDIYWKLGYNRMERAYKYEAHVVADLVATRFRRVDVYIVNFSTLWWLAVAVGVIVIACIVDLRFLLSSIIHPDEDPYGPEDGSSLYKMFTYALILILAGIMAAFIVQFISLSTLHGRINEVLGDIDAQTAYGFLHQEDFRTGVQSQTQPVDLAYNLKPFEELSKEEQESVSREKLDVLREFVASCKQRGIQQFAKRGHDYLKSISHGKLENAWASVRDDMLVAGEKVAGTLQQLNHALTHGLASSTIFFLFANDITSPTIQRIFLAIGFIGAAIFCKILGNLVLASKIYAVVTVYEATRHLNAALNIHDKVNTAQGCCCGLICRRCCYGGVICCCTSCCLPRVYGESTAVESRNPMAVEAIGAAQDFVKNVVEFK